MENAIGYARISKDDQLTGLGVTRQTEDVEKLCKREKCRLVEMFVDNDLSASRYSRKPRPAYQRALERLQAGDITKVVVYDLDRLLRQPKELEVLIDLADHTPNLTIHSYSGGLVNLETADGRFLARILAAKAAKESDDLSRRIKREIQQAAEFGKPKGGGRRPYGFAANRIDHDPDEAAALQRAAATILDGGTLTDGARHTGLNPSSVKRILCSPRAAGLRQHHGEVIGPACWAPIIDRADWERLRGLLCRPTRYSVPIRRHLLSGFARCGECDGILSAQWRKNPVRVIYQCRSARGGCGAVSVDGGHLERTVVDEIGGLVRSARIRRAFQRHLDGTPDDREKQALASIDENQKRLTDLAAQVGEFDISPVEWSAMRRPILDRIEHAQVQLAKMHRRPTAGKVDLAVLAAEWDTLTDDRRRDALRDFGVDVVVARAGKNARRFNTDRVQVRLSWA